MTGVTATPPLCGPSGGAVASPSPAKPAAANAEPFKVLSLFAGVGGFDLGLEAAGGFRTVAFCEFDKKAQAVIRKHWPEVPIYDDVRTLTGERLSSDGIAVDVICGGFPCQDISTAGAGAGIEGERSGLWADYARLIGELRPRYVIVENVSALLARGLGRVLGDLAALGYDADWHCIPASAVGAPHRRDRIWIIAYSQSDGREQGDKNGRRSSEGIGPRAECGFGYGRDDLAHAHDRQRLRQNGGICPRWDAASRRGETLADAERRDGEIQHEGCLLAQPRREGAPARLADGYLPAERQWLAEPHVGRVADGVPGRVDRLKQLGNAVVPQIPELIGRAILKSEAA